MYRHEHKLNGLLEKLDGVDSHGDVKVRDKRKDIVGEVVGKRLSFIVSSTLTTEEPSKGFTVERDAI